MSGAPPGAEKCEPNLTPLLDLVLQLVMFFMLCANFDQMQKNEAVTLPKAAQATPPDPTIKIRLLVELAGPADPKSGAPVDPKLPIGRGKWMLYAGAKPQELGGPSDLFVALEAEAKKHGIGRHAKAEGEESQERQSRRKPTVAVILRIDENVPYRHIREAMTEIAKAGFEDVQLQVRKA